ncbi:MAG: hypothetical protein H6Q67_1695 [Firmicutes bacterium]|nr:hypothetical protein [Bacillota bacterium]
MERKINASIGCYEEAFAGVELEISVERIMLLCISGNPKRLWWSDGKFKNVD